MALILHCTQRASWDAACGHGQYVAPSLRTSGFIHFSTPEQILRVANFLFRGQSGLVLLCVETQRLRAQVRYENLEGGREPFPHVYGPLNLDAVSQVVEFPCESDGSFRMPPALTCHAAGT
jgi:uncharacterized protein (DUF952 family)